MFVNDYFDTLKREMETLRESGMYKYEYVLTSPQSVRLKVEIQGKGVDVLNFCANNYLGLADNLEVVNSAKKALDKYAFGTASVRFICGTSDVGRELEVAIARFLGYDDVITFPSCFQANNGVFQALLGEGDAIISANLNHASLIDGIRLCKAKRFFYQFDDLKDLEKKIVEATEQGFKVKLIVTDGVFSMDGDVADLTGVCDLARRHECLVMVDDCHATGFVGKTGRGTFEECGLNPFDVTILSSTLGKALGGAGGGFIASNKYVIEKLRNAHRGYLFSNNLTPSVAAAGLTVLDIISRSPEILDKLRSNTQFFRKRMNEEGFDIRQGNHPIVPVMVYDAKRAADMAKFMIEEKGVYVIAFSYPVVPRDSARIRVQVSAAHSEGDLELAVGAFVEARKRFGQE